MARGSALEHALERLSSLRQYQHDGKRVPHKPLLVLLALSQLQQSGTSEMFWSQVESKLAHLIAEFGPPSRTGRRQSAAYPFTRLRTDGVWTLSRDVPMDNVGPLDTSPITGRLEPTLERAIRDPRVLQSAAKSLVMSQF